VTFVDAKLKSRLLLSCIFCWQLSTVQYLKTCMTAYGWLLEQVWLLLSALFLIRLTLPLTGVEDGIMLRGMLQCFCN